MPPISPAPDAVTTIEPPPAPAIARPNDCIPKSTPRRFTAMVRSQSSSVMSRTPPIVAIPALRWATCSGPSSAAMVFAAALFESGLVTSSSTAIAVPPLSVIPLAVASARAPSRSAHATPAPCRASTAAVAAPIPDPAPVTTAVLSSSLRIAYLPYRDRAGRLPLPDAQRCGVSSASRIESLYKLRPSRSPT